VVLTSAKVIVTVLEFAGLTNADGVAPWGSELATAWAGFDESVLFQ